MYDLRKTKYGRWFDQKCKIDVVCFIADVINTYTQDDRDLEFKISDIRSFEYSEDFIKSYFSKPSFIDSPNEYDKFFSQPIKMLSYAGILEEININTSRFKYKVKNVDKLVYISLNERNTNEFMYNYIKTVLVDSEIYHYFTDYFKIQTESKLKELKDNYFMFMKENSKIQTDVELARIFNPLLNILAFNENKAGVVRGHVSKEIIGFNELMYNRLNFRDLYTGKPKGLSRADYQGNMDEDVVENEYYRSQKAKKIVRNLVLEQYEYPTEVLSQDYKIATYPQMHHMLKESEYPQFVDYPENIIALTPTQHMNFAHPNNNTSIVDEKYMELCFNNKIINICNDIDKNENSIYSKERLRKIISLYKNIEIQDNLEDVVQFVELISSK